MKACKFWQDVFIKRGSPAVQLLGRSKNDNGKDRNGSAFGDDEIGPKIQVIYMTAHPPPDAPRIVVSPEGGAPRTTLTFEEL
jgi:hypothetical protein